MVLNLLHAIRVSIQGNGLSCCMKIAALVPVGKTTSHLLLASWGSWLNEISPLFYRRRANAVKSPMMRFLVEIQCFNWS